MTEKPLTRLIQAVKEFNIGKETLLQFLQDKKFDVKTLTMNSKLTPEMYDALEKEFREDKKIKEKSTQVSTKSSELAKILESKKQAPKVVIDTPVPSDNAPEPKAEVKATPAPPQADPEFIATEVPKIQEIKIFDSIDIEAINQKSAPIKKTKFTKPPKVSLSPEPIAPPPAPQNVSKIVVAGKEPIASTKPEVEVTRAPEIKFQPINIINKIDIQGLEEKEQKVTESRRKRIITNPPPPAHGGGGGQQQYGENQRFPSQRYTPTQDNQGKRPRPDFNRGGGTGGAFTPNRPNNFTPPQGAATFRPNKKQRLKNKKNKIEARQRKQVSDAIAEHSILRVTEFIAVADLASMMNITPNVIISKCMDLGIMVSINQRIDGEVIELVANEFGFEVEFISEPSLSDDLEVVQDDPDSLIGRPPIVTIMGHVDHGKTSLLDFVRQTNVVAGESGGITQHIGAYEVTLPNGKHITFLDTPGHEAFTAMRARGSKVTDIVVIVIAADDTVMPQTKEAISHAQAAGAPMIFAINKVDKDGANPEKIKEQLASMNILVEDWGGKYQCEEISAKKGTNVDKLLEKILLEAEIMELKANPDKPAKGTVLEASLEKGRGFVTSLLVREGTLRVGDFIVAGPFFGRVKAMFNEREKKITQASLSVPAVILGMNGAAQLGETFQVFESESQAKEIANQRMQILREQNMKTRKHITLEEIGRRLQVGNFKDLNLIVKGDFDGSVEALTDSLQKLSNNEINIRIIHKGAGQISESDVLLASASESIIIGFQVRASGKALELAEKEQIEIKTYSIIYQAIDDVKAAMEGMMSPIIKEHVVGNIDVKEIFKIDGNVIAGCVVASGKVVKGAMVKLIREGIVIYSGSESNPATIDTLRRFKNDAKEVTVGMECGLTLKNYSDLRAGDQLEIYEVESVKQSL